MSDPNKVGRCDTPQSQNNEGVVTIPLRGRLVDVDASLAPVIAALNAAGLETIACCSGHGHRPGNIALRDGRELIVARDFAEARRIDRLFSIGSSGERVPFDGENLRTMRKRAGMRAVDLAAALDISSEHLSRMERGHKPIPRTLELAAALVCAPMHPSETPDV